MEDEEAVTMLQGMHPALRQVVLGVECTCPGWCPLYYHATHKLRKAHEKRERRAKRKNIK